MKHFAYLYLVTGDGRQLPALFAVGRAFSLVGFGVALGCTQPGPQDVENGKRVVQALAHGQVTGARPEIGVLNGGGGFCSATLIAPQWVLTAAHCVQFQNDPRGYFFRLGTADGNVEATQHNIQMILNFGPPGPVVGDLNEWAQDHLTPTADSSGNNDIAALMLDYPVTLPAGASPAPIATSLPVLGSPPGLASDPGTATQFGYGCTLTPVDDSKKRFAEWRFVAPGGGLMYTPFTVINADGTITSNSALIPFNSFDDGGNVCPGDSGGPVVLGRLTDNGIQVAVNSEVVTLGAVWGVNSINDSGIADTFGSVAFLHKPICQAIYALESYALEPQPQKWCVPFDNGPLFVPPAGCESSLNAEDAVYRTGFVITTVCANDPYCCEVNWDNQCIEEGKALFHSVYEVGIALTACDACAAQVCAFDSYCCAANADSGGVWDSICVDEASTTCGG